MKDKNDQPLSDEVKARYFDELHFALKEADSIECKNESDSDIWSFVKIAFVDYSAETPSEALKATRRVAELLDFIKDRKELVV